jgi:hypothetical protein
MGKQSNENQKGGGNACGAPKARLHQPPKFQGKSGQSDNQSTNRGAGKS